MRIVLRLLFTSVLGILPFLSPYAHGQSADTQASTIEPMTPVTSPGGTPLSEGAMDPIEEEGPTRIWLDTNTSARGLLPARSKVWSATETWARLRQHSRPLQPTKNPLAELTSPSTTKAQKDTVIDRSNYRKLPKNKGYYMPIGDNLYYYEKDAKGNKFKKATSISRSQYSRSSISLGSGRDSRRSTGRSSRETASTRTSSRSSRR